MAKKASIATPAQYIASLPEPRQSQIAELDALIRATTPSLDPFVYSGMLGYGPYHYVYASGREGDCAIVSLSSRAQYISLYVGACDENGSLADQVRAKLPKASIGVSCIRFKRIEDLDLKVLRDLLKKAEKWAKEQAKLTNEDKRQAAVSRREVSSRSTTKPKTKKAGG